MLLFKATAYKKILDKNIPGGGNMNNVKDIKFTQRRAIDMKKTYETMEAYRVRFNANEQIAAAACTAVMKNGMYGTDGVVDGFDFPTCQIYVQDGKLVYKDGNPHDMWGTADQALRYA